MGKSLGPKTIEWKFDLFNDCRKLLPIAGFVMKQNQKLRGTVNSMIWIETPKINTDINSRMKYGTSIFPVHWQGCWGVYFAWFPGCCLSVG